jgi:replicative DNA helicase
MQPQPIKNLREYNGADRVISSAELALSLKDSPESRIKVKSSFPSLDAAVDGFQGGELIALSGPTKGGKTLLAQTLTVQFTKQQYQSLWFSYEVPARQFLSRFPDPPPLIYLPAQLKAHALVWIEDRIRESFLKYRTRIVFIDHLHYLFDLARTRNASIEIGEIIRRLKTLAVNEDFLIFLLCHTKMGASESNLSYESIRDSSFVSQESDSVLMIKRTPENGENAARLRVEFHRRTGCLEKIVELVKVDGLLQEVTKQDEPSRKDWE